MITNIIVDGIEQLANLVKTVYGFYFVAFIGFILLGTAVVKPIASGRVRSLSQGGIRLFWLVVSLLVIFIGIGGIMTTTGLF